MLAKEVTMPQPADLISRIVEGLYCDALVLSDEVRAVFDTLTDRQSPADEPAYAHAHAPADPVRLALSCEGLRTTARMMQAIAWLHNRRAFLAGELSAFQLGQHGRLLPDAPAQPEWVSLLAPALRHMIARTEVFYARLLRVDRNWRFNNTQSNEHDALEFG